MAVTVAQLLIAVEANTSAAARDLQDMDATVNKLVSTIGQLSKPFDDVIKLLEVVANRTSTMAAVMEQNMGRSVQSVRQFTAGWNEELRANQQELEKSKLAMRALELPIKEQNTALREQSQASEAARVALAQQRLELDRQKQASNQARIGIAEHNLALAEQRQALRASAAAHAETASAADRHGSALGSLTSSVGKFSLALFLANEASKLFHAGMDMLVEAVVGYNARLETATNAQAVMLRGINSTTGQLNDFSVGMERARGLTLAMQTLALESPFEFKDIQRTVGELLRMGIAVKDVIGLTKDIQNIGAAIAASGGDGAETMHRLAYAIGQINDSIHVGGQELRQMINAGVNIAEVYEIVGKKLGVTTAEVDKMQRAGKLNSKVFIEAFQEWAKINFGDMAAIQAKTFSGAMSNIKEAINIVGSTAFQPLFQRISELAQRVAEFAGKQEFREWAMRVAAVIDVVLDGLGALLGGFTSIMGSILSVVATVGQAIYTALQWINPFARHSPSLVESVEDGMQRILQAFENMGREVPASVQPAADALVAFREVVGSFKNDRDEAEAIKALAYVSPEAPASYIAAKDAIEEMRNAARELIPEITSWKQEVKELTQAHKDAIARVQEIDDEIKQLTADARPLRDEIRGLNLQILQWKVAQAEVNLQIREGEQNLRPFKDALKAAEQAVRDKEMALRDIDAQIKLNEAGLVQYKVQLAALTGEMDVLKANLDRAKDAWSDLNDQVTKSKQLMTDAISAPFEGERDLNGKILEQKARVEEINARLLQAKARGAKTEVDRINKDLEKARAQLDILQSQKIRRFDLPRERLRNAADAASETVGLDETQRKALIDQTAPDLKDKIGQLKTAKDLVEADEDLVRSKRDQINAVNEVIRTETQRWSGLLNQKLVMQAELDILKNQEAAARTVLERENARLDPLRQQSEEYGNILAALEAQKTAKEAELALFMSPLEDLREERTIRQEIADNIARDLDIAKTSLSDVQTAQTALITSANQWQQELDKVRQEAIQVQHEAEAAAKKAGAAGGGGGFNLGDKEKGGLEDWIQKVKDLDEKFKKSKEETQEFFDGLGKGLGEALGGVGELLANSPIGGFINDMGDAVTTWGPAILGFFETWKGLMEGDGGKDPITAALEAISLTLKTVLGEEASAAFDDFTEKSGNAFSSFGGFITDTAIPRSQDFVKYLIEELIPHGLEVMETHILGPTKAAWEEFKRTLEEDVGPAMDKTGDKASKDLPKDFGGLNDFMNGPVKAVWEAFKTSIGQTFDELVKLGLQIGTALAVEAGKWIAFWTEHLGPIYLAFWQVASDVKDIIAGMIELALAGWLGDVSKNMENIPTTLGLISLALGGEDSGLIGLFHKWMAVIRDIIGADLSTFYNNFKHFVMDPLQGVLDGLNRLRGEQQQQREQSQNQGAQTNSNGSTGQVVGLQGDVHAAMGIVVDRPTRALIGEAHQTEIVTPEGLMRKIVREEGGGSGGGNLVDAIVEAIGQLSINVDGEKLGHVVTRNAGRQAAQLAAVGAI